MSALLKWRKPRNWRNLVGESNSRGAAFARLLCLNEHIVRDLWSRGFTTPTEWHDAIGFGAAAFRGLDVPADLDVADIKTAFRLLGIPTNAKERQRRHEEPRPDAGAKAPAPSSTDVVRDAEPEATPEADDVPDAGKMVEAAPRKGRKRQAWTPIQGELRENLEAAAGFGLDAPELAQEFGLSAAQINSYFCALFGGLKQYRRARYESWRDARNASN